MTLTKALLIIVCNVLHTLFMVPSTLLELFVWFITKTLEDLEFYGAAELTEDFRRFTMDIHNHITNWFLDAKDPHWKVQLYN